MLRNRAAALLVLFLSCPLALALGMGTLEPLSALNEPFDARIEILSATANDFDTLRVGLAEPKQFERAGVPRIAVLLGLHFEIVESRGGADYIRISSKEPIREPFLNFLIEMQWATGRLVREYTVLLDPPLYDRTKRMVETRRSAPSAAPPVMPSPAPAAAAMDESAHVPVTLGAYVSGGEIGPIQTGDTLWSLASAHRPDDAVTVQQMMLALLRANPEAFQRNNINMLNRGSVLKIPDRAEITDVSPTEAFEEAKRQHQVWEDYRQRTAGTVSEQPLGAAVASAAAVPAVEAGEAEARLELAAPGGEGVPGAPGEGVGAGDARSLLHEELDASAQANDELRAKLDEADEIIDLLQRQVEIKDEELAGLQARLAELNIDLGDVGVEEVPAEPVPEVPEIVEPLEPGLPEEGVDITLEEEPELAGAELPELMVEEPAEPKPAGPPETMAPKEVGPLGGLIPAYIADVVPGGVKTILGIIGAIILLIVGLIVKGLMGRREHVAVTPAIAEAAGDETITAITDTLEEEDEPITAPRDVEAAGEEGLELADEAAPSEAELATLESTAAELMGETETDPLEEVNVYLAYERFDQAEELVKKVIADHPDEHNYKLRLLEVYYSANDKQAYEDAARALHDAVGTSDPIWESAVAMWAEMSPDRALFEEGAKAPTIGAEEPAAKQFVDITSDAEAGAQRTMAMAPGGDEALAATQIGEGEPAEDMGLDFDIGTGADAATEGDSEIIDLTATGDTAAVAEEVLDLTAATGGTEPEEDMIDLTVAGGMETDEDIIDLTATGDREDAEDIIGVTPPGEEAAPAIKDASADDGGILDLTSAEAVDVSSQTAELLDITHTGDVELGKHDDLLNVTSPAMSDLEEVLDLTQKEPSGPEESEELDISAEAEPEESVFDISAEAEPEESVFDISAEADEELQPLDFEISETAGPETELEPIAATSPPTESTDETDTGGEISFEVDSDAETRPRLDTGAGDEGAIEFDIEGFAVEEATDTGEQADELLDLDLGDTGDLSTLLADTTDERGTGLDEPLEFDLSDTGDISDEDLSDLGLSPEEGAVEDIELSVPESETDDFGLSDDAEAEIEFDLALQDTTDMDDLAIDDTLELPIGAGEAPESTVEIGDQSLEDLTQSMEDAIAGLDIADEEGLVDIESEGLEEGAEEHLETVALDAAAAKEQAHRVSEQTVAMPRDDDIEQQSDVDETDTKLNLAKAYIELGDKDGARSILDEVADDGNDEQKAEARQLLDQL